MTLRTSIFFEIISLFGIILTLILIVIILTKTPAAMKQFKYYLLLYSCHLLCLQITFGIYAPSMLHPYIFFYPMGIAKYFPTNVSISILAFSFFNATSMYDCIIAMIMERYYALKDLNNANSKVAIKTYLFLTMTAYLYLFLSFFVIFFKPLHEYFLLPSSENSEVIKNLHLNLDDEIILDSVIIFHNFKANHLPPFCYLITITNGFRLILIIIYLILNGFLSRKLTHQSISQNLQNHTSMLMKMIVFQFIGIVGFLGVPVITILIITYFVAQSNSFTGYAFTTISFFGIYDSAVTLYCIKPYRIAVKEFVKKCFCHKNENMSINPAVAPMAHQNRLPPISLQI